MDRSSASLQLLDRGVEDGEDRQALADRRKGPHGAFEQDGHDDDLDRSVAAAGIGHRSLYKTKVIDRRGPWLSVERRPTLPPSGGLWPSSLPHRVFLHEWCRYPVKPTTVGHVYRNRAR